MECVPWKVVTKVHGQPLQNSARNRTRNIVLDSPKVQHNVGQDVVKRLTLSSTAADMSMSAAVEFTVGLLTTH